MVEGVKVERYRHETVELTVGQLLEALSGLPAEAPLRIDVPRSPRSAEMRDSIDSGLHHFVVSGVVLNDAEYLREGEVVLQADFTSEWYIRPADPDSAVLPDPPVARRRVGHGEFS